MKLADVIARVRAQAGEFVSDADVQAIARATVRELGLEVADDGEVYNPAPKWTELLQQNVRWDYGPRRGGRRR